MIGLIGRYSAVVNELSPAARCALLTTGVLLAALIALPIANMQGGAPGVQAAVAAAAVCLVSALVAVALASFGRGTPACVGWILAGDGIAMAGPMIAVIVLQRTQHALYGAGFFGWVVVFYLATLVVKTLLVAPLANTVKTNTAKIDTAKNRNGGQHNDGQSAEAGA